MKRCKKIGFLYIATLCLTLFSSIASSNAWDGETAIQYGLADNSTRLASNENLRIDSTRSSYGWIGAYLPGLSANTQYVIKVANLDYIGEWRINGHTTLIHSNGDYIIKSDANGRVLIENRDDTANDFFQADITLSPFVNAWNGESTLIYGLAGNSTRLADNGNLRIDSTRSSYGWIGAYLTGLSANTPYVINFTNLDYNGDWKINGHSTLIHSTGDYLVESDEHGWVLIENRGDTATDFFDADITLSSITSEWDGSTVIQYGDAENSTRSANNHQLNIQSTRNGITWIGAYIGGLKPDTEYVLNINNLDSQGHWATNNYNTTIDGNGSFVVNSDSDGYLLIESQEGTTADYFQADLLIFEDQTTAYPLPAYDVTKESVQEVVEWQAPQATFNLESAFNNQLATFNGRVYVVWIGPDDRPRIASYPEDGSTPAVEAFISSNPNYKALHDTHHTFSIGIDRYGYIHIVGDMHHHPISNTGHLPQEFAQADAMYWVSDQAEDISSFSFMGSHPTRGLNADGWGYTYFTYDRNMKMYLAGRIRSANVGWSSGATGLAIERYDEESQSWTSLGADVPLLPANRRNKTVAWANAGANSTGYQALNSDIYFDLNNRMHIVATINGDNSINSYYGNFQSSTHVLYAYSDDEGESFRRRDGSLIKLPMTPEPGVTQASVVVNRQWLGMMPSVGVLASGIPWVTFEDSPSSTNQRDRKLTVLNKPPEGANEHSFSNLVIEPANALFTKQYVDKFGVTTIAVERNLVRFQNPDEPWVIHPHTHLNANHHFDRRLIMETGDIRYSYWLNNRNTLGVARLVITSE